MLGENRTQVNARLKEFVDMQESLKVGWDVCGSGRGKKKLQRLRPSNKRLVRPGPVR